MIQILRVLAVLEGISYLLLFGLTMPLKYMYKLEAPNYFVGMAHGVLFVLYCLFVLLCASKFKWSFKQTMILGLVSLVPFGTFWAEKKYLRD